MNGPTVIAIAVGITVLLVWAFVEVNGILDRLDRRRNRDESVEFARARARLAAHHKTSKTRIGYRETQ